MKICIISIIIGLLSVSAVSGAVTCDGFVERKFSDGKHKLCDGAAVDILVSEKCYKKETVVMCNALKALDRAHKVKYRKVNSANPGAVICMLLDGDLAVSVDEGMNEMTFCRFDDSSMINTGALRYYYFKKMGFRL